MIRQIRGEVQARGPDMVEVMTNAGVAFEILVPAGTVERLPPVGEEVALDTVLVLRDDAVELFGFETTMDRELFRRLRGVGGVGPRYAMAVLGALPARRTVEAIRGKDHRTLQTVKGIGKKTAERICIELADKLDDLGEAARPGSAESQSAATAIHALRSLGYGTAESDRAVREAPLCARVR